jgi:hypothetical protein
MTGKEPLTATEMAFPYEKQKTKQTTSAVCDVHTCCLTRIVMFKQADKIKLNFFLEPYRAY